MKIPDCNRCQFYSHQLYFVCSVHPDGVEEDTCLDFRLHPDRQEEEKELWSPEGYSYYNGELIPNDPPLTREQQEEILNNHPLFTDTCPNCGYRYERYPLPHLWDCPTCGWLDKWSSQRFGDR